MAPNAASGTMTTVEKIPSLRQLAVSRDATTGEALIPFDDLYTLIAEHRIEGDKIYLRKDNVHNALKRQDQTVRIVDGVIYVTFLGMLYLVLRYRAQIAFCKRVSEEIAVSLLTPDNSDAAPPSSRADEQTVLVEGPEDDAGQGHADLYRQIAAHDMRDKALERVLLRGRSINNARITTLHVSHKQHFSAENWEKIKIFEFHFQHWVENIGLETEDSVVLKKKREYWGEIVKLKDKQQHLARLCRSVVNQQQERTAVGEALLEGQTKHLPSLLQASLRDNALGDVADEVRILCADCNDDICKHEMGIHVFLELFSSVDTQSISRISHNVKREICQSHGDTCREVTFFKEGTFSRYMNSGSEVIRFRDDVLAGKLAHTVIASDKDDSTSAGSGPAPCPTCLKVMDRSEACDWKPQEITDDIVFRWKYSVPLELQVILEAFMNTSCSVELGDDEGNVRTRVQELYQAFSLLLNTLSRSHVNMMLHTVSDKQHYRKRNSDVLYPMTTQTDVRRHRRKADHPLKRSASEDPGE